MILEYQELHTTLVQRYVAAHPRSQDAIQSATRWMPGGNTRSVLHYDPFPIVLAAGTGCRVTDIDGFEYLDCVGEFSAGLFGHNDPVIRSALEQAISGGITLGGPNLWEAKLAKAICQRFPSIEQVRFCNSGTEANLLALVTSKAVTGRETIVVFDGAYHGGVLTFSGGGNPMNVPFDWVVLPYNDPAAVQQFMQTHGTEVAAILVEPILGAGGNIPATQSFLETLRSETTRWGAVLIFDEVKTSRCGPGGVQELNGVTPDLTTLGKYLGAGLPLAAFGGSASIMGHYDPRRSDALKHAGTFNNNVLSMASGLAGLTQVYTTQRAREFHQNTTAYKEQLQEHLHAASLPIYLTGHGSMFSMHLGEHPPQKAQDVTGETLSFRRLLHLKCMEQGVRITGRGDIFLGLSMSADDLKELASQLVSASEFILASVGRIK